MKLTGVMVIILIIIGSLYLIFFVNREEEANTTKINIPSSAASIIPRNQATITLHSPPPNKTIPQKKHLVQSFNNCGPATLAMLLSYYDQDFGQNELGAKLRPYQIPGGDNDDKTVFLHELAFEAQNHNFYALLRPNGSIKLLKQFISNDIPVILITWLNETEDIGHYRIVRGYDDSTQKVTQDDSYQGKNLTFSYDQLDKLWQPFNYQYLIIVPQNRKQLVDTILSSQVDSKTAWANALTRSEDDISRQPQNIYPIFNRGVASYYLGDYAQTITDFEEIQTKLPPRMLWYQIEPIRAYFELGNYQKVFELTSKILTNNNRAFSELYEIRAQSYIKQGHLELAQQELNKAIMYNKNASFSLELLNAN